jgi:3-oxosteroid 1-dehydrogenase
VLDTNHIPIPRLYSAGEPGALYSWHYQGGGNILECMVFGSIAGEQAAAGKFWLQFLSSIGKGDTNA